MQRCGTLILVGLLAACRRGGQDVQSIKDSTVARVGDRTISTADVAAAARATGQTAQAALANLVTLELLAEHARMADPDEAETLRKQVLVDALLTREFEPRLRPEAIPEPTLRNAYQKNRAVWVHGRLVDAHLLTIVVRPSMPAEESARRQAMARDLAQAVATEPTLPWSDLARDPRWGGRVSYQTATFEEGAPDNGSVARAVLSLSKDGDHTEIIREARGPTMAQFVRARPASNIQFEEVRAELARRLFPIWQTSAFVEFTGMLMAKHGATVLAANARLLDEPAR